MTNLIEVTKKNLDAIFDLRYASKNNVCNFELYSQPRCFLHPQAFEAITKASESAKKHGLKFKIWDGFRPLKVQQFMFDKFAIDGKCDFISDPKTGSIPHCRGVAVDLTLVDSDENEIEMGSDFDEFSELAFHNCEKVSAAAKHNRRLLFSIMQEAGFDFYSKEWWHYQLFDARKFAVVEDFEGLSGV